LELQLTKEEKNKKFWLELKDLLAGAAFPVMLMLIFGASILSFCSAGEMPIRILVLVIGEIMLAVAYFVFGRQNGVVAMRKTLSQSKKREAFSDDLKSRLHTGEYAVWKGFVIPLISCVPFIIFQIIGAAAPNTVCEFLLKYCFGWAFYPLSFIEGVSGFVNLVWVVPLCCLHAGAYVLGAAQEKKRQSEIAQAQDVKGKKKKK